MFPKHIRLGAAVTEDPSAGGLRGASIQTTLRLPVDSWGIIGDGAGGDITGRSRHVLRGMLGGERLIPALVGDVQGPGSRCEVL